jgi:hypothetical protein
MSASSIGRVEDLAARGEVRPRHVGFEQSCVDGHLRVVDQRDERLHTSLRLCGGMFVAMPTAMPSEPFTSRFGNCAGRTMGSLCWPS